MRCGDGEGGVWALEGCERLCGASSAGAEGEECEVAWTLSAEEDL